MKGVKILECSNVTLQRHGARHIYVVPQGLKELMMDISREVLRCQPESIYMFCADYCEALMITRENARVAASVVESITDCSITIAELLQKTGIDRASANEKASMIQKTFRKFLARQEYPKEADSATEQHMLTELLFELQMPITVLERAANVIKCAYRAFKERQRIFHDDEEFVNWRKALQNTMYMYRKTGIPGEMARRAASTIQAAYRGYYTRRNLSNIKRRYESSLPTRPRFPPEVRQTFERLRIDPFNKEVQDAAIKIQYALRRYLTRISAERFAKDVMEVLTRNMTKSTSELHEEQSTPSSKGQERGFIASQSDPLLAGERPTPSPNVHTKRPDTHTSTSRLRQEQMRSKTIGPDQTIVEESIVTEHYHKECKKDDHTNPSDEFCERILVNNPKTEPGGEHTIKETQLSPTSRRIDEIVKRDGSGSEYRRTDIITPTSHLREEQMRSKTVGPDKSVVEKVIVSKTLQQEFGIDENIGVVFDRPARDSQTQMADSLIEHHVQMTKDLMKGIQDMIGNQKTDEHP